MDSKNVETTALEARGASGCRALDRRAFLSLFAGATFVGLGAALAGCQARNEGTASDAAEGSAAAGSAPVTGSSRADGASSGATAAVAAGNAVVVYFSWSGRTQKMAERIAELSGAPTFRVEPVNAYPEDYNECTEVARDEQNAGELPAYNGDVENWADVQTVYLGFPIWWMDMPQIIKTFVQVHDWQGKTVAPFCSWYSSGWSGSDEDLASDTGATMAEGLGMSQDDVDASVDAVDAWYAGIAAA